VRSVEHRKSLLTRSSAGETAPAGVALRTVTLPELPPAVRRANTGLKGEPMALGLVRRNIIKGEVLELHQR